MFSATRCGVMTSKAGGGGSDPYWSNVILLLHMDGSNGGTTYTNAKTPSDTFTVRSGANWPTTNTGTKKFGTASMRCLSNTAGLQPNSSASMLVYNQDFCIEAWVKIPALSGNSYGGIYGTGAGTDIIISCGSAGLGVNQTDGKLRVYPFNYPDTIQSTTTVADNNWHHFAITRQGTTVRLFIDGVQEATATNSQNFQSYDTVNYAGIGNSYHYAEPGSYFDEFRITKGAARYTANFTPPTAAFPES